MKNEIENERCFNELEHNKLTPPSVKLYCDYCGSEIKYNDNYYDFPGGLILCNKCIETFERVNDEC